ncbi:MAG: benzoate-CoA ligase family protein [Acidobacteria bacterium]|nr:benzoate-CoA ligase family protein [Acidobacteriota bacterium]
MASSPTFPEKLNVADYFLDRHLREGRGGRTAIAGLGPPLSYEELADRAGRVATAWRELGVTPGDRVLLALPDSPEFIACFFGTVKMGAIAVPVNPFTRVADYAYYAADCQPSLAVVHEFSFAEALPALQEANAARHLLTVAGRAPGCDMLDDILPSSRPQVEPHPTAADDNAFFLYTSGSGGQPKAAMHRHRHMLVTADSFARQVLGVRPDDVAFSASKLFFAYGLGNAMYFPLSVGAATVLLPERVTPEKIFAVLEKHRPTLLFAVPTIYGALLRAAEGTRTRLDFLRAAVSAGEALPAEIFERFRQRFGQEILDGIGTTEMLHMFMSNRPGEARPGSCGRLVPGYQARIVDEAGAELEDGEIGNLWVQGGSAFAGYWGKPELTARTKPGNWVVTGDKFTRDPDGFYHYCGRADDMLKVSGMWVSPLEVENALLAHPAVAEAAVVGQRDPDGLTQVTAYVVLRSSECHPEPSPARTGLAEACPERSRRVEGPAFSSHSPALADELRAFVRRRLPGYKCPQRVEFVAELPKTATGKIQRYKLRS